MITTLSSLHFFSKFSIYIFSLPSFCLKCPFINYSSMHTFSTFYIFFILLIISTSPPTALHLLTRSSTHSLFSTCLLTTHHHLHLRLHHSPERFQMLMLNSTVNSLDICEVCGSYQCPYCPIYSSAFTLAPPPFVALVLVFLVSFASQLLAPTSTFLPLAVKRKYI